MDTTLLAITGTLNAAYPLVLAGTYIAASIIFRFRRGRNSKTASSEISANRAKWIFRLLLLLCMDLLAAFIFSLSCISSTTDTSNEEKSLSNPTAELSSQLAVFLFFGASLLPDPDSPYRPSSTNAYTWLVSLGFELSLVVLGSVRQSIPPGYHGTQNQHSHHTPGLLLAFGRVLCLSIASTIFLLPRRENTDPATTGLLGAESEERTYGAVSNALPATAPVDAQTTNWLDYLAGFGKLLPMIWPPNQPTLQARALVCVLILIAQRVVNVLVPFQLGQAVQALGHKHIPYKELCIYIVCRAIQGQQGVLASVRALLWIPIGQATYRRLTQAAFEHVMSLSLQFHLGKRLGDVVSALNKGSALNTFIESLIFQLFPMVADIGFAAVYLLVAFGPFYSLIILTMGGMYLFVTIYMAKYRGRARREMVNRDREMDAIKTDAIMSYEVVHYNDALQAEQSRFGSRVTSFQKAEFSVLVSLNLLNAVQNIIFTLGVVMVSFLSAYHIAIGVEEVALFVSLLAYLAQLQAPLSFFGSFYTQIQNNLIDAERMLSLFDEKPSVVDKPTARDLATCCGHIRFDDVSFAYDPRRQALHGISLSIPPGTSTAIVGESGSGKSTMLRLLFRFYDVDSGCISIDGMDVGDIAIRSLRSHFGVVPQDAILFNDTLMYNLLYANPAAAEKDVFAACRAASVHDKILALPDGYETRVGERGLRLSGGEKQRIAIARAILKSPTIILMDEATASLDSETEKAIQESLAKISVGRTSITIAHRLSTIVHCDQIVVMHEGRIVEKGSHAQLLAQDGRYRRMWDKQTKESGKSRETFLG